MLTELCRQAADAGVTSIDLDDLIHDLKSQEASAINNGGLESQIKFLIKYCGREGARQILAEWMEKK